MALESLPTRIVRLEAENERLRQALRYIAGPLPREMEVDPLEDVASIMRRIARAALFPS